MVDIFIDYILFNMDIVITWVLVVCTRINIYIYYGLLNNWSYSGLFLTVVYHGIYSFNSYLFYTTVFVYSLFILIIINILGLTMLFNDVYQNFDGQQ